MEYVVLVNELDVEQGTMEKIQAHREGRLHRAISVFIFNSRGEMLLQQRAAGKYHSSLLWTNACCSHPRHHESMYDAAVRRLREEMGIACELQKIFTFLYKARLDNELTEHELDHVFTGISDDAPLPDPAEVAAWRYIKMDDLDAEIAGNPAAFTEWFKICLRDWREELSATIS
ncbi:MAG: isopentenyl-diphosphate Delta-isomerase [Bacteroidota bacterium]